MFLIHSKIRYLHKNLITILNLVTSNQCYSSLSSWIALQVVIVIGSSASGVDICRDIAKVAKEVHVSSRSTSLETYEKLPGYDNLWLHPTVLYLTKPADPLVYKTII